MGSSAENELVEGIDNLDITGFGRATSSNAPHHDPYIGVIRSSYHAINITQEFTKASNALRIGQLVKDESFTLFDSVQALEIMDPKMDSGFLEPGESLEEDYDLCRELLPEEIIGIMDQMLCYEMAWHQGYPLAQNLLTSLYIEHLMDPERPPKVVPSFQSASGTNPSEQEDIVHMVLRPYCIGVIKSCDIVIEMIQTQHYYEEEDFNTHTFNRNMLTDVDDNDCLDWLKTAEDWIRRKGKMQTNFAEALIIRLRVRRDFLNATIPMNSELLTTQDWSDLQTRIEALKASHELGSPVKEAFSPKVQRRLASTVPPRPITELQFEEACKNLSQLYRDLQEALDVSKKQLFTDPEDLLTFLWTFSARESAPSAFARAMLQALLFSEGRILDSAGMGRLLLAMLDQMSPMNDNYLDSSFWTVEVPTDWRYQVARDVDFFIEQASPEYLNVFRSLCQNRCRVRRCLVNVARDFDVMHQDVTTLATRYFGDDTPTSIPHVWDKSGRVQWTICNVIQLFELRIVQWIHRLGFEQDIYRTEELTGLYLDFERQAIVHGFSLSKTKAFLTACRDYKDLCIADTDMEYLKRKIFQLDVQANDSKITVNFADALSQFYLLLARLNAITTVSRDAPYGDPVLQHELRMRPFSNLKHGETKTSGLMEKGLSAWRTTPFAKALPALQQSLEETRDMIKARLKQGTDDPDIVGALGSEAAWIKDTQATLRACVSAIVAFSKLKKGFEKYGADGEELQRHLTVTDGKRGTPGLCWIVPGVVVS